MDADQIKRSFKTAKLARQPIEAEMHLAFLFTNPNGSPRALKGRAPDRSAQFDTTVGDALTNLVANTVDNLIPRTHDWINFVLSEEYRSLGLPTAQLDLFLSSQRRKFFQAVNGSNFRLSAGEALADCFIAGAGAIGVKLDAKKRLYYTSIPVRELYYLDNGDCVIDVVFRECELPARTVAARYKTVPDWIRELAEKRPDETVTIIESMVPGKKADTFEYSVWTSKGWEKLSSQVTNFPPFVVFRSERTAGSVWGDSFVRKAIGDVRSVNQMMADTLDNSALSASPPMRTDDPNLEGKTFEARKTYYIPAETHLSPIVTGADFNIAFELIKSLQESIRRALMAQVLPDKSRMNSEEVQVHQSEFYRRMSVHGLRLEEEFLEPVVRATILALQGAGRMEKKLPDGTAFSLDDDPICLEMNSIDTRVKFQREADRIVQTMATLAPFPGAARHIDPLKAARYLYDLNKMPAEIMVPIEEVEAAFKAEQEANVYAQALAIAKGQGSPEGTKALGEGVAQMQKAA